MVISVLMIPDFPFVNFGLLCFLWILSILLYLIFVVDDNNNNKHTSNET